MYSVKRIDMTFLVTICFLIGVLLAWGFDTVFGEKTTDAPLLPSSTVKVEKTGRTYSGVMKINPFEGGRLWLIKEEDRKVAIVIPKGDLSGWLFEREIWDNEAPGMIDIPFTIEEHVKVKAGKQYYALTFTFETDLYFDSSALLVFAGKYVSATPLLWFFNEHGEPLDGRHHALKRDLTFGKHTLKADQVVVIRLDGMSVYSYDEYD